MNAKGFAPILIVLIIAILGIGGYFVYINYSQNRTTVSPAPSIPNDSSLVPDSSDKTTNWKTYSNTEYKFSLDYPQNFYHYVKEGSEDRLRYKFSLWLSDQEITNETANDYIHEWPDFYVGISSKLHTEQELKRTGMDEGNITEDGTVLNRVKYEQITLSNQEALKETYLSRTAMSELNGTRIYFNKGGFGWTIHYPNNDYKGNHKPIYDQILSTFKFTQ